MVFDCPWVLYYFGTLFSLCRLNPVLCYPLGLVIRGHIFMVIHWTGLTSAYWVHIWCKWLPFEVASPSISCSWISFCVLVLIYSPVVPSNPIISCDIIDMGYLLCKWCICIHRNLDQLRCWPNEIHVEKQRFWCRCLCSPSCSLSLSLCLSVYMYVCVCVCVCACNKNMPRHWHKYTHMHTNTNTHTHTHSVLHTIITVQTLAKSIQT